MIRLTQICLLVFLATLGFFLYQLQRQADYSLAFLMMGATGCLYLLLRTEQRYTYLTRHRAKPAQAQNTGSKRIAPQCVSTVQFTERKMMPILSASNELRAVRSSRAAAK
ncbi:hypothetical protein [Stenotrophobium rhamnosiphilum]|uniref:Uncharacterized protein n=1 Tax=Stenotrophobium rhamnosiphilum TaxID=2029166 RepID=A0A2T5MFH1_9GAMM|nr:hypothetical protein [Stenotrophobium rhamnosiphilum]PTU31310.1 hypothetical protein CJD38_08140 [Stenotrophobium rhamnosiphilum]